MLTDDAASNSVHQCDDSLSLRRHWIVVFPLEEKLSAETDGCPRPHTPNLPNVSSACDDFLRFVHSVNN